MRLWQLMPWLCCAVWPTQLYASGMIEHAVSTRIVGGQLLGLRLYRLDPTPSDDLERDEYEVLFVQHLPEAGWLLAAHRMLGDKHLCSMFPRQGTLHYAELMSASQVKRIPPFGVSDGWGLRAEQALAAARRGGWRSRAAKMPSIQSVAGDSPAGLVNRLFEDCTRVSWSSLVGSLADGDGDARQSVVVEPSTADRTSDIAVLELQLAKVNQRLAALNAERERIDALQQAVSQTAVAEPPRRPSEARSSPLPETDRTEPSVAARNPPAAVDSRGSDPGSAAGGANWMAFALLTLLIAMLGVYLRALQLRKESAELGRTDTRLLGILPALLEPRRDGDRYVQTPAALPAPVTAGLLAHSGDAAWASEGRSGVDQGMALRQAGAALSQLLQELGRQLHDDPGKDSPSALPAPLTADARRLQALLLDLHPESIGLDVDATAEQQSEPWRPRKQTLTLLAALSRLADAFLRLGAGAERLLRVPTAATELETGRVPANALPPEAGSTTDPSDVVQLCWKQELLHWLGGTGLVDSSCPQRPTAAAEELRTVIQLSDRARTERPWLRVHLDALSSLRRLLDQPPPETAAYFDAVGLGALHQTLEQRQSFRLLYEAANLRDPLLAHWIDVAQHIHRAALLLEAYLPDRDPLLYERLIHCRSIACALLGQYDLHPHQLTIPIMPERAIASGEVEVSHDQRPNDALLRLPALQALLGERPEQAPPLCCDIARWGLRMGDNGQGVRSVLLACAGQIE